MTIGERNRQLIRLCQNGMTTAKAAETVRMSLAAANKVVREYPLKGEETFRSTKEWTPEIKEEEHEAFNQKESSVMRLLASALEQMRQADMLRQTIRKGDKIRVVRDNRTVVATVCDKFPNVVLADMLKVFDICREYFTWIHRQRAICPTYIELAENGNR